MAPVRYRLNGPCGDCPWRTDVEPGQFEAYRFDSLKTTSTQPEVTSAADVLGQPMFACHQTQEGREQACAGWLVVAAAQGNLRIRLALATGDLPPEAVEPGPGWPPLFESYDAMADRQGRPDDGHGEIKPPRQGRRGGQA
ncbi:DUF6283 family protein [Streptomyces violaceusniger]|uniref:Uncharacterized protein n=1 Tax=Streptomyces violaceusniger (strain Tu 4113) TaxID=653045 RepID=G2PHT3_STRV4|nr:DUF6283 family protein [Streptomyces violaceusniger]AEM88884.1 hypothetical protein Strvi_0108 [Streptomyces violaceusniger Tu 4113]